MTADYLLGNSFLGKSIKSIAINDDIDTEICPINSCHYVSNVSTFLEVRILIIKDKLIKGYPLTNNRKTYDYAIIKKIKPSDILCSCYDKSARYIGERTYSLDSIIYFCFNDSVTKKFNQLI